MLSLLFFSWMCFAQNNQMQEIREKLLLNSNNLQELHLNMTRIKKIEQFHIQCELELKSKEIPVSCFRYIKLQAELDMISPKVEQEQFERIDRLCVSYIKTALKIPTNTDFLGKGCQSEILLKQKKQKYVLEELKPEEIILGTHQ